MEIIILCVLAAFVGAIVLLLKGRRKLPAGMKLYPTRTGTQIRAGELVALDEDGFAVPVRKRPK